MATLGTITVPAYTIGTTPFPIKSDFGTGTVRNPKIVTHRFGSADALIYQRFYLGNGAKTFAIKRATLSQSDHAALESFWLANQGIMGVFPYAAPNPDGSTTSYHCRFQAQQLSFTAVVASILSPQGLVLQEVPQTIPSYTVNATQTRFPSNTELTALLNQVNTMIPLMVITPRDLNAPTYPAMYIADRDVTLSGQLWQARILKYSDITQATDGSADNFSATLGNADRVLSAVKNSVSLYRAYVQFSLFHVETGIKIDLWAGNVMDWALSAGPEFTLSCSDPASALGLTLPPRSASRTCQKIYNDGVRCPFASKSAGQQSSRSVTQSDGSTSTYTFVIVPGYCDKGFDTPSGCMMNGMDNYFGGTLVYPQAVKTRDNSTGFLGFGRKSLTSVSTVSETAQGQPIPLVFCDYSSNPDETVGFPVNALMVDGRDEGDFYDGLGIVCEGPIGAFATQNSTYAPHKIDDQPPHGWPNSLQGLRLCVGWDPVENSPITSSLTEPGGFSLSQNTGGQYCVGPERAAGTVFAEIRRQDAKGLQPSLAEDHSMTVTVRQGLWGWVWTAPGVRTQVAGVTNPFWVAANCWFVAKGLYYASATVQEASIDVASFIACAAVADTIVPALIGTGTETQFQFVGLVGGDVKPLRDWLTQILNCALGYFNFSFGRLRVGCRYNSSVISAFNTGNILFQSLQLGPRKPSFNFLTGNFADQDYIFQSNTVVDYDSDHALMLSQTGQPEYIKATINYAGSPTKSQTARLVTTRLREELGGAGVNKAAEWTYASKGSFSTTILALDTEAGQICSLGSDDTMLDLPNYPATDPSNPDTQAAQANYLEARIKSWTLRGDYSIDFEIESTHNDVYGYDFGNKPADNTATIVPADLEFAPDAFTFTATSPGDGTLILGDFQCALYSAGVQLIVFEIYYEDETVASYLYLDQGITASVTTIPISSVVGGLVPPVGSYILAESEIILVTGYVYNSGAVYSLTVTRGQLGTTAASHFFTATFAATALGGDDTYSVTVATGMNINPSDTLLVLPPSAASFSTLVASYDPLTGILRTTGSLAAVTVGTTVLTVYKRVIYLQVLRQSVTTPARFFTSGGISESEEIITLPSANVAMVRAQLQNQRNEISPWFTEFPTPNFPWGVRTGSASKFQASYPQLATGTILDAFQPYLIPGTQSFLNSYAQLAPSSTVPVPAPRAVTQITADNAPSGGTITVGGTVTPVPVGPGPVSTPSAPYVQQSIVVYVNSGGNTEYTTPAYVVTTETTAAQAAASLATWLNADPHFGTLFAATVDVGTPAQVDLADRTGNGGTIVVSATGTITAVATGMNSPLEVFYGRTYSIAYQNSTGAWRTELGPASVSSGPSGGATRFTISDVPYSTDSRIDTVTIWGWADGILPFSVQPRLVGYFANNTAGGTYQFFDTNTEAGLAANALYTPQPQPAQAGDLNITVNKDGVPWYNLFIPATSAKSTVVDGTALGNAAEGAVITADLVNNGNPASITLYLN